MPSGGHFKLRYAVRPVGGRGVFWVTPSRAYAELLVAFLEAEGQGRFRIEYGHGWTIGEKHLNGVRQDKAAARRRREKSREKSREMQRLINEARTFAENVGG